MAAWTWVSRVKQSFFNTRLLLLVAAVLLAAGCSGDGGVDLGGGQEPDPVVVDMPVAYVKQPLPVDNQDVIEPSDARELITFNIGADLFMRDRASPSAVERNITGTVTGGLGAVQDAEFSYDGARIVFAMRAQFIEGAQEEDQPTWNIWIYEIETDQLSRVISPDITAEAGHDLAPHFLPDGRIIFSSTRQRQSKAILLDEGKPQFSAEDEDRNEFGFQLHVMNDDGSEIKQVTFNQSHDQDPSVLSDGRVVFSRWDNMAGNNAINLYRMNPDGTELELLYGKNSHDTGTDNATIQFLQAREMPDGQIIVELRPFVTSDLGGDLNFIDTPNYVENTQPVVANAGVLTGPAQTAAVINDVRTNGEISPGGKFGSVFPLWDGTGRMFVTWSQCRLVENEVIVPCTPDRLADPAALEADPLYGIWIYDRSDDTQLPVVPAEEGILFTDVVAAQPRTAPPVIVDKEFTGELDPELILEGVGLLNIRSVYDINGVDTAIPDIETLADPAQTLASERPARFLRVIKAVSLPDRDVLDFAGTAFGRSNAQGMKEIIGYAPIEPDGSVIVKVPADVALAISVLDANGRRITPRHQSWLQVRPGEVVQCDGCHDRTTGLSHGRRDAFDSVYQGAVTTGIPFPNTEPALFTDIGESMAETRMRVSCATDCNAIEPSVDVVFEDVWTDEVAAGRQKDASFSYLYSDLDTPAPVAVSCLTTWTNRCRTVINYETFIHPLWGLPRVTLDIDGITVLADNTCTNCHNTVDLMAQLQVPDGQLDLTDGLSADQADHFRSYRELLFGDNEQEIDMGALVDRAVQVGVDPITGDPILAPVPVAPSMSVGGANASAAFFSRFDAGGSHTGYLTPAELRLVSEWLDIGGQYYNNPFDAPLN